MFIDLKKKSNGAASLLTWSIRRAPSGVYYAVNDDIVTFDPNGPVKSGLREKTAKIEAKLLNEKRGPAFGFDFKGY